MIVTHKGKEIAEAVFLEKQDGMCQNTYTFCSACVSIMSTITGRT